MLPQGFDEIFESDFIRNEMKWPFYPILPVKNVAQDDRPVGIILAGSPTTIIDINMCELVSGSTLAEQIEGRTVTKYDSILSMVRDGWVAD